MSATSTDLTPWNDLQAALSGTFKARAHGIVSVEYALTDQNGREFGRLRESGGTTDLDAGALRAAIERTGKHEYRMISGDAEILTAAPIERAADTLGIRCAGRFHEAHVKPFRNTAVATDEDGERVARVVGGFAGRNYGAVFDDAAEGALPVAVLLLHHLTTIRGKAYRA